LALNVNQVLAGVIFLGALALCFDRVLLRLQRRFENWRVF
jgi:ABC-type nitrate/sulfonate/bicarbonate transport system permease component